MSNVFADGFATYGVGGFHSPSSSPILLAMLAGRYAAIGQQGSNWIIGQLPWAPADPDLFLSCTTPDSIDNQYPGARVILPSANNRAVLSCYFAMNALPSVGIIAIAAFSDGSNNPLVMLGVTSTGALIVYRRNFTGGSTPAAEIIAESSGPALTAQSAAHIEMQLDCGTSSSNAVHVQANGVAVISATGLSLSYDPNFTAPHPNSNPCAQVTLIGESGGFGAISTALPYIGNVIIRDGSGSVNNAIVGDRRVATLFVNGDDAQQGWTGQPLKRFGAGILDLTQNAAGGTGDTSIVLHPDTTLDISNKPFTIEGSFRFQGLPAGSNKQVLYSHRDEVRNQRECELYVGGPSLEGGNTVFRISTDGTGGTIQELISWPVQYVVGHWYHLAVARDGSNNLRLFVNGILQGLAVSDSNTYFAGGAAGAAAALGADTNNGGGVAGTGFDGWVDEFRLTINYCRYTATFAAPVAAFPRGGLDAQWAQVAWISGFDSGAPVDESSFAHPVFINDNARAILPLDGAYNFQTIDKPSPPLTDTFIEAALLAASQILTYTALPTSGDTITLGTKDGTVPAVYTWKTALTGAAFEVKVGASVVISLVNLVAAINAGAGAGTIYGTGTTANYNAGAAPLSTNQLVATALAAGAAGNSIACATTDPGGSWGDTHLVGGQDIPGYSQFTYSRLPSNVTTVDSITILALAWKTDAGVCTVKTSFVGGQGAVTDGSAVAVTTAPAFTTTLIEADPDTTGPVTPTTVTNGKIRVARTT